MPSLNTLSNVSTTGSITLPANSLYVNTNLTNLSSGSWNISLSEDLTDFFELVLAALGHDITYDDFSKMTKSERNQIIREIKLKTIL
jgi:hypothetical protein